MNCVEFLQKKPLLISTVNCEELLQHTFSYLTVVCGELHQGLRSKKIER